MKIIARVRTLKGKLKRSKLIIQIIPIYLISRNQLLNRNSRIDILGRLKCSKIPMILIFLSGGKIRALFLVGIKVCFLIILI